MRGGFLNSLLASTNATSARWTAVTPEAESVGGRSTAARDGRGDGETFLLNQQQLGGQPAS